MALLYGTEAEVPPSLPLKVRTCVLVCVSPVRYLGSSPVTVTP